MKKIKSLEDVFQKKNLLSFNELLKDMYTSDILQHKNTNAAYNTFLKRYLKIFETCFPLEEKRFNKKAIYKNPWYSRDLAILNKEKQKNYKKYIENKNNEFLKRIPS